MVEQRGALFGLDVQQKGRDWFARFIKNDLTAVRGPAKNKHSAGLAKLLLDPSSRRHEEDRTETRCGVSDVRNIDAVRAHLRAKFILRSRCQSPLPAGSEIPQISELDLPRQFNFTNPSQWLPDGRVLAQPNRSRLWAIQLTGKLRFQSAEPWLTGPGTVSGFSSDSSGHRFVRAAVQQSPQIWSVPMEANGGRVKGVPESITEGAAFSWY